MSSKGKKKTAHGNTIALNKKAKFDYHLEEKYEAGMALEGWEVKSMRAGRAQLKESYVIIRNGELFLFGAHISPLTVSIHAYCCRPYTNAKLLLEQA